MSVHDVKDQEITLTQILLMVRRNFLPMTALFAVLAIAIFSYLTLQPEKTTIESRVVLGFEGIESNSYPNGLGFSMRDLINHKLINQALDRLSERSPVSPAMRDALSSVDVRLSEADVPRSASNSTYILDINLPKSTRDEKITAQRFLGELVEAYRTSVLSHFGATFSVEFSGSIQEISTFRGNHLSAVMMLERHMDEALASLDRQILRYPELSDYTVPGHKISIYGYRAQLESIRETQLRNTKTMLLLDPQLENPDLILAALDEKIHKVSQEIARLKADAEASDHVLAKITSRRGGVLEDLLTPGLISGINPRKTRDANSGQDAANTSEILNRVVQRYLESESRGHRLEPALADLKRQRKSIAKVTKRKEGNTAKRDAHWKAVVALEESFRKIADQISIGVKSYNERRLLGGAGVIALSPAVSSESRFSGFSTMAKAGLSLLSSAALAFLLVWVYDIVRHAALGVASQVATQDNQKAKRRAG